MYEHDLSLLVCPKTLAPLTLRDGMQRDPVDGEIIAGELVSPDDRVYPIVNGIPRFVDGTGYNPSWDFKWTEIDRGEGLNYRLLDPGVENLFELNSHCDQAWRRMRGGVVLDIGCGVGQYSIRALREGPERVVSMDLTRGVDVFRTIILSRFPEMKKRLFLVQASVFAMPFRRETFDYVFSLGVLHHTGGTIDGIRKAAALVKPGGQVNIWVYAPMMSYTEEREPGHLYMAPPLKGLRRIAKIVQRAFIRRWMRFFRLFPVPTAYRLAKPFASEFWYRLSNFPVLNIPARIMFTGVNDPDYRWRLINVFDAYWLHMAEPERLAVTSVLNVGIGYGAEAMALATLFPHARIAGVDLNLAVVSAGRRLVETGRVDPVVASLFHLPFADASFDHVHSQGVLHHTWSTKAAFDAIERKVGPAGTLFVWLYAAEDPYVVHGLRGLLVKLYWWVSHGLFRPVLSRAPAFVRNAMTHLISLVLHPILARRGRHRGRWAYANTLHGIRDAFTPRYAHQHGFNEVVAWYEDAGYEPRLQSAATYRKLFGGRLVGVGVNGRRRPPQSP